MKISLQWLNDFVKLPKNISPEDLAERLTAHTVEVEGVEKQNQNFSKVVVGKVLEVAKHPNADRLRLAKVDIKTEVLHIVCGAPNLAVDQLVAVALIGAVLPGGLVIKESEIRGEKSFGMICAEDELGIGQNHEGIMVLGKKAKVGQSFASYLGLDDTILEIDNKSLSNRSDLWGHYGLSREVSAFYGTKLIDYEKLLAPVPGTDLPEVKVKVEDKELCLYYSALQIDNVKVKDSPDWLRRRLLAVGLRPINNIVDATNYVMLELGQPLHAFSAEKIEKIVVRRAKKGESIEALDEKEYSLTTDDLVIADSEEPVAIAGVIGGAKTAIHPDTNKIILEAANFQAVTIRKTAGRIGVRTDSSVRFEKTLDPHLCPLALRRALKIIQETCKEAKGAALFISNPLSSQSKSIILNKLWLDEKIGLALPAGKYQEILENLGFRVEDQGESLVVDIPSWRSTKDVKIAEDLLEEIIRIYGYNNIPATSPEVSMVAPVVTPERKLENKLREILAFENHLQETYNYSFVGENQLQKLNIDSSDYLRLANPISSEHTMLRKSLAPNLISNLRTNQFRFEQFGLFEIGRIFLDLAGSWELDGKSAELLPYQEKNVAIALMGSGNLFLKIKGIIEDMISVLSSREAQVCFLPGESFPGWADSNQSAVVMVGDEEIGLVSVINKETAVSFGLKKDGVVAELSFGSLAKINYRYQGHQYHELPKYPEVRRDLSFVVDSDVLYNDLRESIASFNDLISEVELFDVYEGNNLPEGKKSLAFSVVYQSSEKTLVADDVDVLQKELFNFLADRFGAQIRNF